MDNLPGSPRNYLATYAISSANTWEQKSITIALDTTSGWTSGTPPKFRIVWDLGSGTTQNGTAGVWSTSNFRRTSACVILVNNTAATWQLTGVQFEIGTAASAFEFKPFQQQLAMCQRYYWKSFLQGTAPVQNAGANTGEITFTAARSAALTNTWQEIFPVTMASTPTVTLYNEAAANAQVRDTDAVADCSGSGTFNVSPRAFNIATTGNATTSVGNNLRVHATADTGI